MSPDDLTSASGADAVFRVGGKNIGNRSIVDADCIQRRFESSGMSLNVFEVPSLNVEEVCPLQLVFALNLGSRAPLGLKSLNGWETVSVGEGDIVILPPGHKFSVRCEQPLAGIVASMSDALLVGVLGDRSGGINGIFGTPRVTHDPFIAESLKNLARNTDPGSSVFRKHAEALAVSLASHLVGRHSSSPRDPVQRQNRRLSVATLAKINELIDRRLSQPIRVEDLARVAGLSPFHFSRVFKATTGKSPYRYIMNLRLSRGVELLRDTDAPVAEIATEIGFCDQSHFTRELSRTRGMTPRQVRMR